MEIILSKVRKAPNRDDFKATLQYVRKDGKKVTRSQFSRLAKSPKIA